MKSIRSNGAMIKKVYVPKYIYPFSGILANFIIFLISLIVLVGVMVFFVANGSYHAPMNGYMVLSIVPLVYSGNGSGHDTGYPVCILQRY